MKKPNCLVMSGYGLNSEEETKVAFELAGANAKIIHINDLISSKFKLKNFQIMAFPGGFAFGDDTGAGNAFANKIKLNIWKDIKDFVKKGNLVIGICNGFQIIVNLGLLPAINFKYGKREVALLQNDTVRYIDRWVDVKVENNSPWLKNLKTFPIVISHGEGRLYTTPEILKEIKKKNLIALRYVKGQMCEYQNLKANPTGTLNDIAGITDESGRVFGLMPHGERAMFFTQRPDWLLLKEKYLREGKDLPEFSEGIEIFKNAVKYFSTIV